MTDDHNARRSPRSADDLPDPDVTDPDVPDPDTEAGARPDPRSWWRAGLGLSALALVAAVVVVVFVLGDRVQDPLPRAMDLAADASNFATAEEAAVTLVQISELLEEDARACLALDPDAAACKARLSATGWSRVAALPVLGCTAPGRAEIRLALIDYLEAISLLEMDEALTQVPPLPECAVPDPTPD